jgi:hypothetical protein
MDQLFRLIRLLVRISSQKLEIFALLLALAAVLGMTYVGYRVVERAEIQIRTRSMVAEEDSSGLMTQDRLFGVAR